MKYTVIPLICVLFLLGACKESGPAIDFGLSPKATDTFFTAAVETAQSRVVVIEEFTGVSCPPCPQGHKVLKTIEQKYPNNVAILGIQAIGPPQTKPLDSTSSAHPGIGTRHDNRTDKGTQISTDVYGGLSSIPIAGINRAVSGGLLLNDRGNWVSLVDGRIPMAPQANVTVKSTYDAGSRQAVIKVHVAYTGSVTRTQNLTVALVENNVIDAQEGDGTGGYNKDYVHQHVLRDVLTAATGTAILNDKSVKVPGLVYERTFIYNVDAAWNADNCQLIAFVLNDGADKEVVQGARANLK